MVCLSTLSAMSEQESERVQLPQVGLKAPGAGLLADLQSLSRDVVFAAQCAEQYAAWANQEQHDENPGPVPQALWSAAAISYRRAFTSGRGHLVEKAKRIKLGDAFLDLLSAEQRQTHEQVMEMANQPVAHRVGVQEGAVVTALLAPPPQPRAILGVGSLGAHMIGPPAELTQQMVRVCEVFFQILDAEVQTLSDRLIAQLVHPPRPPPGHRPPRAAAPARPEGAEQPGGAALPAGGGTLWLGPRHGGRAAAVLRRAARRRGRGPRPR